ncbi:hypothetical protein KNU79_gp08 [Gordonia phage NadineRae]|uniref:Uncharacterized protein n=1 Tax=Gordonia phage NadineRae TaxID=2652882 RepID=A0A5P8DFD1_9CAUD|nr:hypothetical protein KNU79_gp08 [Gordonia phage NadineRae]QFP97696.1 hypothetical protein SEA_NADINERAE_8 [Gordonia phage NadineRae]
MPKKKDATYLDVKVGDPLVVVATRRDFDAEMKRKRERERTPGRRFSAERLFKEERESATVTRVGTKYVYATCDDDHFETELQFAKDTGRHHGGYYGDGTGKRAFTEASYAAFQRRSAAEKQIREFMGRAGYAWPADKLTTDALEEIAEVVSNERNHL